MNNSSVPRAHHGASSGLQMLGFLVIAGCISTSMMQLNMFLSGFIEPGMFRNVVIFGMCCALIGSQVTMALATQAVSARIHPLIICVALLNIVFTEGMSVASSQASFNSNMIAATSGVKDDSEDAAALRKSIRRSEARIDGFDITLSKSDASNMTNRETVLASIGVEEDNIRRMRSELRSMNESDASKAFAELPFGLGRSGLASVWAWSLTIGPASISILIGALGWKGREPKVASKKATGKAGKKIQAVKQALAA